MKKVAHVLYVPLLGLGLYGGHRGSRWLRNRIHIFNQFVLPSLLNQTNKDFILWVSVRWEDRHDSIIKKFKTDLEFFAINNFKVVFTYSGICFWDDKYPDEEARIRLVEAVHGAIPEIANVIGEAEFILMTIQPSDDCYYSVMVEEMQRLFEANPKIQAATYKRGYVMDYANFNLAEWNPTTNPPFYTIKFPREIFMNPTKHVEYAGIKSHEYLPEKLITAHTDTRAFLVGTHGENISTIFNHPFKGDSVSLSVLREFGLEGVERLKLPVSLRKRFMRALPHGWQRKLRYWLGERTYARFYAFIRS